MQSSPARVPFGSHITARTRVVARSVQATCQRRRCSCVRRTCACRPALPGVGRHDLPGVPGALRPDVARCARVARPALPALATRRATFPARTWPLRKLAAACEVFALATLTHARPAFGIDVGRGRRARGRGATRRPRPARRSGRCCTSARTCAGPEPRVLIVAPMSGHFATLLRETVRTMLADHDVYITDWHNARDVPRRRGALRPRRVHRARDARSSTRSGPARTWWRSASRASRRWPPSR